MVTALLCLPGGDSRGRARVPRQPWQKAKKKLHVTPFSHCEVTAPFVHLALRTSSPAMLFSSSGRGTSPPHTWPAAVPVCEIRRRGNGSTVRSIHGLQQRLLRALHLLITGGFNSGWSAGGPNDHGTLLLRQRRRLVSHGRHCADCFCGVCAARLLFREGFPGVVHPVGRVPLCRWTAGVIDYFLVIALSVEVSCRIR